ncbi:MAG: dockerin type I repeat-containing protein [Planctomycetota bacterium]
MNIPRVVFAAVVLLAVSTGSPAGAQPANDACSSPILVVNLPSSVPFNTAGATPSAGLNLCPNMGEDLWYSVVAPANGLLEVRHNFNPNQHAVYVLPAGATCPTDSELLFCDDLNQNESYTSALAGETYLIRISRWQGGATSGVLTLDLLPPPANDDCTNPQVLNLPDVVAYDAEGATPTQPPLSCPISRDLWYEVTPTASGLISVLANPNNQSTAFGVNVVVYASPGLGQCPSDSDEVWCQGASSASFNAAAGVSYLIRIGYPFGDAFPAALLAVSQSFAPPIHDDCTSAQPVAIPSGTPFDTTGATPDVSGLACHLNDDIWFGFTAPGSGQIHTTITGGASLGHQLYRLPGGAGSCPTNFDEAGPCWNVNESWTTVVGGQDYIVRVGQSQPGPTAGTLNLDFIPTVANDDCANAALLAVPSMSTVTTLGSSPDTTGLRCSSTPDTWYRFTIPSSGLLHLEFGEFVVFGIYQHSAGCPTDADLVACQSSDFGLIPVLAGEEYLLRVATFNSFPPVTTTLTLAIILPAPNDDCAGGAALPIQAPTLVPVSWDNLAAADDVNGLGCNVRRDLWYAFTAPVDGCMEFASNVDGHYALYDDPTGGTGCPTANELVCFSALLGQPDIFDFPVVGGQGYLIRVGGFSPTPQSGNFTLDYITCVPENVTCDATVTGQVTVSYAVPAGSNYDLGVEVRLNNVLAATIPQTQTTYTFSLPAGFTGVVQFGLRGVSSTSGTSAESRCAVAIGGVANDQCANATPVAIGTHVLDNSIAALDAVTLSNCTSLYNPTSDVWFSFSAPDTALYTFSTCAAPFATRLELHSDIACSGAPGTLLDCSIDCSLSYPATQGTTYLVRVLTANLVAGVGTLTIVEDCPQVGGLNCIYDCVANEVSLSWTGGQHVSYDVTVSSGQSFPGITGSSLVISNPPPGLQTFDVRGYCASGSFTATQCSLFIPNVASPASNLVLALEGLDSFGAMGLIDGGGALTSALISLGQPVSVLSIPDFDQFPCFAALAAAADTIWVSLGTFPNGYRLSAAEGDTLAALAAAGTNIYIEGADHWGTNHVDSLLDDRDGIEPDLFNNIADGDDSFTTMQGVDSGLTFGDFSSFGSISYSQDTLLNDLTDRLVLTGTDTTGNLPPDVGVSAGACWSNVDDTLSGEPAYITGVLAEHVDGGRMISCSFELGGFGGDPVQLIAAYLDFFEGVVGLPMFRRGDVNGDGAINIADAVYLLGNLFPVGVPNALHCLEAADGNNDGGVNLADVVAILGSRFGLPPAPLPAPYGSCGTAADAPNPTGLGCATPTCP